MGAGVCTCLCVVWKVRVGTCVHVHACNYYLAPPFKIILRVIILVVFFTFNHLVHCQRRPKYMHHHLSGEILFLIYKEEATVTPASH